ncbi:CYTH and CHAD domain-containing protein [Streptomyces sp. NBC_01476]|uniref:CYTH and CHAD domain-containing protein n=1 Tax=Streptomyces sp. NBC_01476 TaxID=2903881 RepID=UPI002E353D50|nr:CYTH and CHAD domain-containing protein [Streptomyces sp. NBC_01476]
MGERLAETERKYEAAAPGALVEFEGLPGVAEVRRPEADRLDAVYYDTADLALATHRVTLRRRTGGQDEGWHLKLPTARPDTRTEVHAPLGSSTAKPPKALRTEVAALVRARPLGPVVRLRTVRRRTLLLDAAGLTLAEIAYDDVHADLRSGTGATPPQRWAPGPAWAETEVELGPAGRGELLDAVEERLLAAGLHRSRSASKLAHALGDRLVQPPAPPAVPQTAGQTATAYLHAQLTALLSLDPAVRRAEEDAVHRMRVATRRARSALKSFGRELDRQATDPLGAELKWLAAALGLERDREVLADRLAQRLAELPPALAAGAPRLRAPAGTTPGDAHTALVRELDGARYFALLDAWEALLAAPPYLRPAADAPAPEAAAATVRRDHARLRAAVESALALDAGEDRDTALHEARKDAKRARYSSEAAEPVLGARASAHTTRMKTIQQLLGEHQDSYLCRTALIPLRAEAVVAGEDPAPYDAMIHRERDLATAVETELPAAWQAADQPV